MTKKDKQQTEPTANTQAEKKHLVDGAETEIISAEHQHDDDVSSNATSNSTQNTAKNDRTFTAADKTAAAKPKAPDNEAPQQTAFVKKSGSGLALLAILLALVLAGAGYYFGQQQVDNIQQKLTALENQVPVSAALPEMPDFARERSQLEDLSKNYQAASERITALERNLADKEQAFAGLQTQINKLNRQATPTQPSDWLLSEADFLLTDAQRKLTLDNDPDTSVALLKVADETLAKVPEARATEVRKAIGNDIKRLLSLHNVDQNAIMQHLSQLANTIDELEVLDVDFNNAQQAAGVSDNVSDWRSNMQKSAQSFLNHFITVTPRNAHAKELLAPNQDIYLRENIRLRLQIAILAVPRQQNDLYKQSLETVASWVRSYFNTNSEAAVGFLKSVDELAEQTIYVDLPEQLSSLATLDKILNKPARELPKSELPLNKGLMPEEADGTENKTEQPAAAEHAPQAQ